MSVEWAYGQKFSKPIHEWNDIINSPNTDHSGQGQLTVVV